MFDVFSGANQYAAIIREYYEAFVRQGFTSEEAFELIRLLMTNLIAAGMGGDE